MLLKSRLENVCGGKENNLQYQFQMGIPGTQADAKGVNTHNQKVFWQIGNKYFKMSLRMLIFK